MAPTANPLKTFVRDTDLAARWGVSRQSVWRWVREGRIPVPVRLAPSTTRWRLADIERFEEEQAKEGAA